MEERFGPLGAIFYRLICGDDESVHYYVPGGDPSSDGALGPFVEEAFERLEPSPPQVVTSPPPGATVLTGFPIYLAVEPSALDELSGTITAGEFAVTATIRPVETRFAPSDGTDAFVCDGNGSVWTAGARPSTDDCTHTFTSLPADGASHRVTAQVVYHASYTVTGPILAGDYDLGSLAGPETTITVPVTERRAVRTAALD